MITGKTKLEHLEWAIQSRASNQKCCLALLGLFEEYSDIWKTKKYSRAAQDLIAVAFSLWRAAFLAEKTGKRTEVFADGKQFLQTIIEGNAISYPLDKKSKEWTFNYYTRNARSSLQNLHTYWEIIVPAYQGKKRNSTERWDYCQELLDEAVASFQELLKAHRARNDRTQQVKTRRTERRQRRQKVRELTRADRN
jgi:hypothetical protein